MDDVKLKAALMAAEKKIKRILYPPKPPTLIETIMGKLYRGRYCHITKQQIIALNRGVGKES